jgi:hypothetical protein
VLDRELSEGKSASGRLLRLRLKLALYTRKRAVKERRGPTDHTDAQLRHHHTACRRARPQPLRPRVQRGDEREREEGIGVICHGPFLHGPRATYESPIGDKFHYYNDIRRPHLAICRAP